MPVVELTSAGGTRSTYEWKSGEIEWEGRPMMAIVVNGFPREGGTDVFARAVVVNQILARTPEAAGPWGAFAKYPPGFAPPWKIIGMGIGTQPVQSSGDVPVDVVRQLEAIPNPPSA